MTDDIFKKACLLQFTTSVWSGQKMLEANVMEKLGDSSWLKGRKILIDTKYLGPVKNVIAQTRNVIQKISLPFPVASLNLIPKCVLNEIEESLLKMQSQFHEKVREFEEIYSEARNEAEEKLGELFNELDYPVDISSKFKFEWRYVNLSLPGKNSVLSPEIYEREKQKFVGMMEETREMAIVALRQEFAGLVNHLAERLTCEEGEKPKQLRKSMLSKLNEFLDSFGNRNLFKDDDLKELVEKARAITNGVDVKLLRDNGVLREKFAVEMEEVKTQIDQAVEDIPRRKIRLAA